MMVLALSKMVNLGTAHCALCLCLALYACTAELAAVHATIDRLHLPKLSFKLFTPLASSPQSAAH